MKFTVTPLGGVGRNVRGIAGSVVRYLVPNQAQQALSPVDAGGFPGSQTSGDREQPGAVRYYADSGEGGRWFGRGAEALGLRGEVLADDFGQVLAGRDPRSGQRLISAQGSAGRRPRLGVGTETRHGPHGEALYNARDAAAVLGLPEKQAARMIAVGTMLAIARLFDLAVRDQAEGSYLAPVIDADGQAWVTEDELGRCEDALGAGTSPAQIKATGPPNELVPIAEAARLVGVTPRYLRQLAKRYETLRASIERDLEKGRPVRRAYLVAERGTKGRWFVQRGELAAFVARRRMPAVRVGYDLTLTTEKSLGVLALLSGPATREAVLDAIRAGNDWAMGWLERHAAAARENDTVIPVKGWAVASFAHYTSRALDPFPHHHNVIANTVEDHTGVRRALDARGLYRHARAASALATAEMRYQLTRRLGVRWRPAHHGGWEIAGIPPAVLREFSRRANEITDALRELEDAIGRGATPDEFDHVKTTTRPDKTHVTVEDLLADWWRRAEVLGLDAQRLSAATSGPVEPRAPDVDALYAALAAPDGICAHLSIFDRADVLAATVNQPLTPAGHDSQTQPPLIPAQRLEELADGFLASRHVEQLTPGSDTAPARYTTRDMLAVQDRIVARYRAGRHRGAAVVARPVVDAALARHPQLTGEQRALVQAFTGSGHRIQCAIGHPGTGKTTAMAAARDAWQAAGWRVLGAAVKGEAARTLGAKAGIPTETLAWYLAHQDPLSGPLDARTVLVVDEASTVSDRDLDRLGWLTDQTGATLRLIGDPAQHGAIEAGGMVRVLCERHPQDTPRLTRTHRLQSSHDRAAADLLRAGDIAGALAHLDAAGHLHIVENEIDAYTQVLARWWHAHRDHQDHPMVSGRHEVRRALNRLAHQLRRAAGEIGTDELAAVEDRRYSVGDRVIARIPDRHLHPPGRPHAYIRNGATGTITAFTKGDQPDQDRVTVDFDALGTIELPRAFFDEHDIDSRGHRRVGIDHAYAVTSYAVTGADHPTSTSRIDPNASRAETYVDITRGRSANHLYLTRQRDDLDGEHLPRVPPDPLDQAITERLVASQGERTAWELRDDQCQHSADRAEPALTL